MSPNTTSQKHETFVRWFLRFNGYFSIENFIVHDPAHVSNGTVANRTEVDTLAVRLPFSREERGQFVAANWPPLVSGSEGKYDIVIAESKSGKANKPNNVWSKRDEDVIRDVVRFIGLHSSEEVIDHVASKLGQEFKCDGPDHRYRYIIFCDVPNRQYVGQGVTYLTYQAMVRFLVEVRGQSWTHVNRGVTSIHYQWHELVNEIFRISNEHGASIEDRCARIIAALA